MKREEIIALQNAQMEIMDEIHKVCVKNNLRYYLIGGSALGAVRHKGIIPWDIDIDIAMPRIDYEMLIHEFANDFSNRFSIHDYSTDRDLDCPHMLVYLNDSIIIRNSLDTRDGIYVDVLPLDSCPNGKIMNKIHGKHLAFIKSVIANRRYRKGHNRLNTIIHRLLSLLLGMIPIYYLNRYQQRVMIKYNKGKKTTQVCSKASHYTYKKLCMPVEYFGQPILMPFSGRNYFVPNQVDNYLTQLFGDYMKLPPKETQIHQMQSVKYARWKNKEGEQIEIGSV